MISTGMKKEKLIRACKYAFAFLVRNFCHSPKRCQETFGQLNSLEAYNMVVKTDSYKYTDTGNHIAVLNRYGLLLIKELFY